MANIWDWLLSGQGQQQPPVFAQPGQPMAAPLPATPAPSFMARWPQTEMPQATSLFQPTTQDAASIAGPYQAAAQMAPRGIPWQQWPLSQNIEDRRNADPRQTGIELLKHWVNLSNALELLQKRGQQ